MDGESVTIAAIPCPSAICSCSLSHKYFKTKISKCKDINLSKFYHTSKYRSKFTLGVIRCPIFTLLSNVKFSEPVLTVEVSNGGLNWIADWDCHVCQRQTDVVCYC